MTDQEIAEKVLGAVAKAVEGTEWAPPEGGVLVDCLVVMMYRTLDGEYGTSWLNVGSAEQAEGMARKILRTLNQGDMFLAVTRPKDDS